MTAYHPLPPFALPGGRLSYVSQSRPAQAALNRAVARMRLGGSGNLLDPLPAKPPQMHWRTYWRRLAQSDKGSGACARSGDRRDPAALPGTVDPGERISSDE